jgi:hypothetical protein
MINLLSLLAILSSCFAASVTPHASPSTIVSVKAHPIYSPRTIKKIITMTANVVNTNSTYNKTNVLPNKTNILVNKTNTLINTTNVLVNKTNVLINNTKVDYDTISRNVTTRTYLNIFINMCIIIFLGCIGRYVYYKIKNIKKPIKNQYLPLNVIDGRPIIQVSRNEFNPYNRDNEHCYKRLSGNNSPV